MESANQVNPAIPPECLEEFEAAARRPLETRCRYAFIKTYKPVMDDEPFRAFASMEAYRRWCETNLPGSEQEWPPRRNPRPNVCQRCQVGRFREKDNKWVVMAKKGVIKIVAFRKIPA